MRGKKERTHDHENSKTLNLFERLIMFAGKMGEDNEEGKLLTIKRFC